MKEIIKNIIRKFGFELKRSLHLNSDSSFCRNEQMMSALLRRFKSGLGSVNTIVDVGAAQGNWSLSAKEIWPFSNFVLFEPLHERQLELNELCLNDKNFHFISAAAGEKEGQVDFFVSDDLDGSGVTSKGKNADNVRLVRVKTISGEITRLELQGPYIIKLDTHGFEVPILEGCASIISQVSLFIIECYGFYIARNSLLFWEMCQYMESLGFRLIDIVDVSLRPKDNAFWQCDAFFIPQTHEIFNSDSYK